MKISSLLLSSVLLMATSAWGVETMSDFDRFYCDERGNKNECVLYRASVINLFTTPEKFHGKKVRVTGYLSMGYEESVLFFMKGANHVEAVWFEIGDRPLETEADVDRFKKREKEIKAKFNNRYVLVEGEFDMNVNSRFLYRGAIKNITRIEQRSPRTIGR